MTTSTMTTNPAGAAGIEPFTGFPRQGLDFLARLRANNTKAFFDEHRAAYESALLGPARAFVVALGEELRARVSPAIRAEPRVDGSILRMNRDLRFSPERAPYKDHLHLVFWEGEAHSRERPCFSVRLRPEGIGLGAGIARLEREALAAYRAAVVDERAGAALEDALTRAAALPEVSVSEPAFKRVPRGIDPHHPRAALLRHGGVLVSGDWAVSREISSTRLVRWTAERLEAMAPVERWLTDVLP
jgi:uncharacterized protein (TIGR02453 family)